MSVDKTGNTSGSKEARLQFDSQHLTKPQVGIHATYLASDIAECGRDLGSQRRNGVDDAGAVGGRERGGGRGVGGGLLYGRVQGVSVAGNGQGTAHSSCIGYDGGVQGGDIGADGCEITQNRCRSSTVERTAGYNGEAKQGGEDALELNHFELGEAEGCGGKYML